MREKVDGGLGTVGGLSGCNERARRLSSARAVFSYKQGRHLHSNECPYSVVVGILPLSLIELPHWCTHHQISIAGIHTDLIFHHHPVLSHSESTAHSVRTTLRCLAVEVNCERLLRYAPESGI